MPTLARHFAQLEKRVHFTRSEPYHKNDSAHLEQRNYTHVRAHFGYDRYDNSAVVPLLNALCKGSFGILQNQFFCAHKLSGKQRDASKSTRIYVRAQPIPTRA